MARNQIKGLVGILVGVTLGGEVIRQAGSLPKFGSATQILIGAGIVKSTAKSLFRFK